MKKQKQKQKQAMQPPTKPTVIFDEQCYEKIMHWVNQSAVEVSGLGKCKYDKEQRKWLVSSVYLLDQENTATDTDLDPVAIAKLQFTAKDDDGHLNFWWHSHVNMGVFWSGTDLDTIYQFGEKGFCLATVFNKKKEMRSAYYQGATDFLGEVFIDEMHNEVLTSDAYAAEREAWSNEFKTKCKTKKYKQPKMPVIKRDANFYQTHNWTGNGWVLDKGKPRTPKNSTSSGNLLTTTGQKTGQSGTEKSQTEEPYIDGQINSVRRNMRYCTTTKAWVTYEDYIEEKGWNSYGSNMLDHSGMRLGYISAYEQDNGALPDLDEEVDDYFMEVNAMNPLDFYIDKEDLHYD